MSIEPTKAVKGNVFVDWFNNLASFFIRKSRLHDFTSYNYGLDYVFDPIDSSRTTGYLTGHGHGIRKGDRILFQRGNTVEQYWIEKVEYYASPPDMWIALLKKSH